LLSGFVLFQAFCQVRERPPVVRVKTERGLDDLYNAWNCFMDERLLFTLFDRDLDGEVDDMMLYAQGKGRQTYLELYYAEWGLKRLVFNDEDGRRFRKDEFYPVTRPAGREEEPTEPGWYSLSHLGESRRLLGTEVFNRGGMLLRRHVYGENGALVLMEHYGPTGMVDDRRFLDEDGRERAREFDTDGDGSIDKIQRFDKERGVWVEQSDEDGDGWFDEKKQVEPGS
jgi:hypothetical protein